jgi:hypothetical protein
MFSGFTSRVEQVDREAAARVDLERALVVEHRAERVAVQLLHHEVVELERVLRDVGGDDLDDVLVLELRERLGLALHPLGEIGARREVRVQRLQHVPLVDGRILDLVDGAHAAHAEDADHLVLGARDCRP